MSNLEQAARQALDAMGLIGADLVCGASIHRKVAELHGDGDVCPVSFRWHAAFAALERALDQQQAEPVAWLSIDCIGERYLCFSKPLDNDPVFPLYAHPPQQAEPVADPKGAA
jgi:hypothetical protein